MMTDKRSPQVGEPSSPALPDEAAEFEAHALKELKRLGLRITSPRVQVIRALVHSKKSLNAYEVHEIIHEQGGKVDLVSVYRILATLEEVGLIHHIGLVNGYFPARISERPGNASQVVVFSEGMEVLELHVPTQVLELLREQAESHGFIPHTIKIEMLAQPSA